MLLETFPTDVRKGVCMHVCYWYGMLLGGKEIRRTYTCETESIAKSIERGLTKHSIYVVESKVYEVNNYDDITYFESI